jgi:hypothetical protein
MGIVQHHDAISGTERQDVADDYALRLSDGIAAAEVRQCVRSKTKDSDISDVSFRMLLVRPMPNFYQKIVIHHHQHHSLSVNYQILVNVYQ